MHFDISFPFAGRVYSVALRKGLGSLSKKHLDVRDDSDSDKKDEKDEKDEKSAKPKAEKLNVEIDFKDIEHRIETLPLPVGGYQRLGVCDNKLLFLRQETQAHDPQKLVDSGESCDLGSWNWEDNKSESLGEEVQDFAVHGQQILIISNGKVRVIDGSSPPPESNEDEHFTPRDGWIDLGRIRLEIDPRREWLQIYREAWALQREHFWNENLGQVDWEAVYQRYLPLLEKLCTRRDLSDVIWEMQGELGTSHCYEFGGDFHRKPPWQPVGELAGRFRGSRQEKGYQIEHIFQGDNWLSEARSPLSAPGVELVAGDTLLEIDGIPLSRKVPVGRLLENRANREVQIKVRRKNKRKSENLVVKTLQSSQGARYREWVEKNREWVHKETNGEVGYLHIPNMGVAGFAEFYRGFLAEYHRKGLVIDVRFNGGGFVSALLLRMLTQKAIGYQVSRWNGVTPYPEYAVGSGLVCLTNEWAGSDGDIFSHAFKLNGLGKLIGTRTWGGVIGIDGKYSFMDGSSATQPEYSFWFHDVGYGVENYGTDPDIFVDRTPTDWQSGRDPQLERGVKEVLKVVRKSPDFSQELKRSPDLRPPKLPHG